MHSFHVPRHIANCTSCTLNTMSAYFKSLHTSTSTCTDTRKSMSNKHEKMKIIDPPIVRKESPVSKPKDTYVKANIETGKYFPAKYFSKKLSQKISRKIFL